MQLFHMDKRSEESLRFNPLTILFINMLFPFLNTVFASNKAIIFTLLFSLSMLLIVRKYRVFFKSIVYLGIFLCIYYIVVFYIKNYVLVSTITMMILFLPNFVLAYLLVSEYNSSELLSALQAIKLPKIFIIGLTVTLRYIPTFRQEFRIIKEAMNIRGVKFSIRYPLRTYEYLLVPQLYRCLHLSNELTAAALTKGLDSPSKRSSFYQMKCTWLDVVSLCVLSVGFALIIGGIV